MLTREIYNGIAMVAIVTAISILSSGIRVVGRGILIMWL
jgi:hypothetical protein